MREFIDRLLNEYISAKKEKLSESALGSYIRAQAPAEIYSTGIVNKDEYQVVGSVGKGNWASNPWVSIFNKKITTSATEGVYIVYLLSNDGESLYLTLNQGFVKYMESHRKMETIQYLHKRANEISNALDSREFLKDSKINLGNDVSDLGQLYQAGTIFYKEYKRGQVPNEDLLRADLCKMVEIYSEYICRKAEFSDESVN